MTPDEYMADRVKKYKYLDRNDAPMTNGGPTIGEMLNIKDGKVKKQLPRGMLKKSGIDISRKWGKI